MQDFDWEMTIRRVTNGYVITNRNDEYVDGIDAESTSVTCDKIQTTIVQDKDVIPYDNHRSEAETMAELLRHVKDYFGVTYCKHDSYNLVIEVECECDCDDDDDSDEPCYRGDQCCKNLEKKDK